MIRWPRRKTWLAVGSAKLQDSIKVINRSASAGPFASSSCLKKTKASCQGWARMRSAQPRS